MTKIVYVWYSKEVMTWKTKTWPLTDRGRLAYYAWLAKNENTHQIQTIFVNNGYGVQYRKLRKV